MHEVVPRTSERKTQVNLYVRVVGRISEVVGIILGLLVFVLSIAMTAEVISRKIFRYALLDNVALGQSVMLAVGFLGAAYALKEGRHIRITLLTERLSPRAQRAVFLVESAVSVVFLLFITWRTFEYAMFSRQVGQMMTLVRFPVWVLQMVVPIGLLLLVAQLIAVMIERLNNKEGV